MGRTALLSPEDALEKFKVAPGYPINLFASEVNFPLANPMALKFDARGRLWVLCTWAYPQLKPGEKPNDKLLILEDTKGDGKADKISTYIDGLNMPTGFALGHGGAQAYSADGRHVFVPGIKVDVSIGRERCDDDIALFRVARRNARVSGKAKDDTFEGHGTSGLC